ncbi:thioredoxin family protein [Rudaea sp.]|uniref:thioredoxin family protein n=1 Tax=Rudaea sp. TaxID=2136325 RepID=UPI002ED1A2FC
MPIPSSHPFSGSRRLAAAITAVCAIVIAPLTACAAAAQSTSKETIDAALKAAKAAHEPVLVDFSAIWCHSCWWMKTNVMNGAEWDALGKHLVYVESDSDSADGEAWMKKLKVTGLPTYVMLDADGKEIGRIVGEAKREEFYPKVNRLAGGADTLEKLKSQAVHSTPADVAQALDTYAAREDYDDAFAWYAGLPAALREQAAQNAKVTLDLEAMHMKRDKHSMSLAKAEPAKKATLAKSCVEHGQRALASAPGYDDRIDIIDTLGDCSEDLPQAQRKALLAAPIATAVAQLDAQKLSLRPLPPGSRDSVLILGMTSKAIGDEAGSKAIFDRGIAAYRSQMDDGKGGLDLKKDRSAGDDLYALYRFSDNKEQKMALLKQLAATYDDDCNYSLGYGKALLTDGKAAEALPYLEKAAGMATGRYVLRVANVRAKALLALQRRPEAEKVVADALQAAGSWFPEDQKELKQVLAVDTKADAKKKVS